MSAVTVSGSLPTWFELLFAGLFGLVFGSFATVLTARIPAGASIVRPGSHCPNCNRALTWYQNLPLVGFTLAGGKCRGCGQPISWRYPLTELVTAGLFIATVAVLGLTFETLALLGLAVVTMPLVLIDLDLKRLPNALTGAAFIWGAVCAAANAISAHDLAAVVTPLTSTAVGAAAFFLLNVLSRGGMGMGDVKLVGALGMLLAIDSWRPFAAGIALAFLIGGAVGILMLITRRGGRKTQIPFGPYLLLGAWLSVLVGPGLQDGLLRLWGL